MRRVICFLLTAIAAGSLSADIYVVTHSDTPVQEVSKENLRDLYLGRTRALPNGDFALVYDRESVGSLRSRFYDHVAGMDLRQVDAFWARLVFAGRVLPLEKVRNDEALQSLIAQSVNAVGYLESPPDNPGLKVIYRIAEQGD